MIKLMHTMFVGLVIIALMLEQTLQDCTSVSQTSEGEEA